MSCRQARCIFGCDTFGVSMHGFPNKTKYPAIFEAWLSVIPENIAHGGPEKVQKSLKVCDYHFKPEHRTRGHGITKTAIPCLYLEGVPKVITNLDTEHNYCLPRMKLAVFSDNVEMEEVTVKWEYFNVLYEADKCYGELRLMHKLTEEHVLPEKINKMRVKPAAQIFSHNVVVGIKHWSIRNEIAKDIEKIIPIIQMIDKLFDSLNVGTFYVKNGKMYTGAIKKNSPHHKLWNEAKSFFNSVVYVDKVSKMEKRVPTVKNWIKTIEGFQLLWKTLNEKYSQDSFLTRNCNQDPLDVHLPGLKERIKSLLEITSVFWYYDCNTHREIAVNYFTNISTNLLVYSWCKSVNRILSGKYNYDGEDQIKLAALSYYIKHKTKPKK